MELKNVAVISQNNLKAIALYGGVDVIVRVMIEHLENTFIQKEGCRFLGDIALCFESGAMIAHRGGITIILLAMKTHKLNAGVIEEACDA